MNYANTGEQVKSTDTIKCYQQSPENLAEAVTEEEEEKINLNSK